MKHSGSLSSAKRSLLETYLRGRRPPVGSEATRITRRPTREPAPLSPAQEQIWRREQTLRGEIRPHNECITIRPSEYLDAAPLEHAFAEVVRRHEIWRTTYDTVGSQAVQVAQEPADGFPLQIVDLRAARSGAREARLQELCALGVLRPFDLRSGPLLRVTLATLSNTEQCIIIFAHLSIVDGVSVYQILPFELASLYNSFAAGKTSPFGDLPIQYADYAYWHQQFVKSQEAHDQLNYWRQELSGGVRNSGWLHQDMRRAFEPYRGTIRPFTLRDSLRSNLAKFSQSVGATLFATLAASLGALIYGYTGQPAVVLLTPTSGVRKRPEVQGLLGHFLNPVALRIDFSGDPSFREILRRTQAAVGAAMAHDEVPLQMLGQALPEITGSDQEEAFSSVGISLQPKSAGSAEGWRVTSMDADNGGTIWDLYLAFIESQEGLVGRVQYSSNRFDETDISRILSDLQEIMEAMMSDLESSVTNWLLCLQRNRRV